MTYTTDEIGIVLTRANPFVDDEFPSSSRDAAEIYARVTGSVAVEPERATARRRRRVSLPLGQPRIWTIAFASVALLAAASGVVIATRTSTAPVAHTTNTAWRSASPLATISTAPSATSSPSWHLVASVSGWEQEANGPYGVFTCPSARACYVSGVNVQPFDDINFHSLYFSGDGGQRWAVIGIPLALDFTTNGLSCVNADTCFAGATYNDETVLAATTDGGHRWTLTSVHTNDELSYLSCSTAQQCEGILAPPVVVFPNTWAPAADEVFVRTSNGGVTWTKTSLPRKDRVLAMSCPSATRCVLVGTVVSHNPNLDAYQTPAFSLRTADSGATWTAGVTPGGTVFVPSSLSCGSARRCVALGSVPPKFGQGPEEILATSDGGLRWKTDALPNLPAGASGSSAVSAQLNTVSCPSATTCWISGVMPLTDPPTGPIRWLGLLIGTSNGGQTWTEATPAGGATAMSTPFDDVDCVTGRFCLALGGEPESGGHQGRLAGTVPIYGFGMLSGAASQLGTS